MSTWTQEAMNAEIRKAVAKARRDERRACFREITDYANRILAPGVGSAYRDAARLLLRDGRAEEAS